MGMARLVVASDLFPIKGVHGDGFRFREKSCFRGRPVLGDKAPGGPAAKAWRPATLHFRK
jgi:hypothetical protein